MCSSDLLAYLNERDRVVRELSDRFKAQPGEIVERVSALQDELKATGKALAAARSELAMAKASALAAQAVQVGTTSGGEPLKILVQRLDGVEGASLQVVAQKLQEQVGIGTAVVMGGLPDPSDLGKVVLVAAFGSAVVAAGQQAGRFIGDVAKACGGGGGGRPNLAQAGGRDGAALDGALKAAAETLRGALG